MTTTATTKTTTVIILISTRFTGSNYTPRRWLFSSRHRTATADCAGASGDDTFPRAFNYHYYLQDFTIHSHSSHRIGHRTRTHSLLALFPSGLSCITITFFFHLIFHQPNRENALCNPSSRTPIFFTFNCWNLSQHNRAFVTAPLLWRDVHYSSSVPDITNFRRYIFFPVNYSIIIHPTRKKGEHGDGLSRSLHHTTAHILPARWLRRPGDNPVRWSCPG